MSCEGARSQEVLLKEAYTDSFEHTFDAKGRVIVPSEWRSNGHETRLHIMPSEEGCLKVYPSSYLAERMEALSGAPFDDPRRKALQMLASSTQSVSCDQQGRIVVKEYLRKHAGLKKAGVLRGCFDHFEIWDPGRAKSHETKKVSLEQVAREAGL